MSLFQKENLQEKPNFDKFQVEEAINYLKENTSDKKAKQALDCLVWNFKQKEEAVKLLSEVCKKKDEAIWHQSQQLPAKQTNLIHVARNIVNQLFDIAGVSVEVRQSINDVADEFVLKILAQQLPALLTEEQIELEAIKLSDKYAPNYSPKKDIEQTDEFSGNDIKFLERVAYRNGYKTAALKYASVKQSLPALLPDTEKPDEDKGFGKCKEKNCRKFATMDYNGNGHWVCDSHYESLNRYFDEEYR